MSAVNDAEEMVVNTAVVLVVIVIVLYALSSLLPSLKDALTKAISEAFKGAGTGIGGAAATAIPAAAKGFAYGVAGTMGSTPDDVDHMFSGNSGDPGYDFIYGPDRFSWQALRKWISGVWYETYTGQAFDANADAGAIPVGTAGVYSNEYNPDQATQSLISFIRGGGQ